MIGEVNEERPETPDEWMLSNRHGQVPDIGRFYLDGIRRIEESVEKKFHLRKQAFYFSNLWHRPATRDAQSTILLIQ